MIKSAWVILIAGFAIAIALCNSKAEASDGDVWISPYSHTKHYKDHGYTSDDGVYRKYQDSHPSIGIEVEGPDDTSFSAGLYNDSYGGTAMFIAKQWDYGYGIGATAGTLISYNYTYALLPFVGPTITLQLARIKASIAYLPTFGAEGQPNIAVLTLSMRVNSY